MKLRKIISCGKLFALASLATPLFANTSSVDSALALPSASTPSVSDATSTPPSDSVLQQAQALDASTITAKKLDQARAGLAPTTGTSLYHIDMSAVQNLAQGEDTPMNQVLLNAPGVAQDSYGQLHIRGEHDDIQFRINGVLLPEGLSGGFSEDVDTRFADHINFLTGSLPAQYGLRTAGVIEIQTKTGSFDQGGRVSMLAGSDGTLKPSAELQGHEGNFNYYLSGAYSQTDRGIESPTAGSAIHDQNQNENGFAYLSWITSPNTRVNAIFGTDFGNFQIPNNPNQSPGFSLSGSDSASKPSNTLNDNQHEQNHFAVFSLEQDWDHYHQQISLFGRYSQVQFDPDSVGDLLYTGVSSQVYRRDMAAGLQWDASYKFSPVQTLRFGAQLTRQDATNNNTSAVFTTDSTGVQNSTTPEVITDNSDKIGYGESAYLQDEFKFHDLDINGGLRYDAVQAYVQEWQLSPRLNAVYHLGDYTDLHLGYASYFSPPSLELVATSKDLNLFANTTNGPLSDSTSQVRSERDQYFDGGVAQDFGEHLHAGLDAYYKYADYLIDEGQFGQALVFTPFNYRTGQVYGVELSMDYHYDKWHGFFNAALSHATGREIVSSQYSFTAEDLQYISTHDIYLDHDQRVSLSGGVSYQWKKSTFSTDGLFGSGLRQGEDNTESMPAYFQWDAAWQQKWVWGLESRVAIKNLLDQPYELRDGSGIGVWAPQWAAGRTFYLGLSKAFAY